MELHENQSALILDANAHGEITVKVASIDLDGVTAVLCQVIAQKLTSDIEFQTEVLASLDRIEGNRSLQ